MLYSPTTDGPRGRRLLLAVGATALILTAVATYSLVTGRHDAPRQASEPSGDLAPVTPAASDMPGADDRSVLMTADPEQFAREVATALFTWDTATMTTPVELAERLVAVADPTGESSAGLVSDIANYLPTPSAWTDLRQYEIRQWIEITSTSVPNLWATAEAQAGSDGLLPGTTAYTIRGLRHRSGVWEGAPVTSEHDVAFTVFMVCAPSYPECHLLRLSLPDMPLE